jgi:hypothetical protein
MSDRPPDDSPDNDKPSDDSPNNSLTDEIQEVVRELYNTDTSFSALIAGPTPEGAVTLGLIAAAHLIRKAAPKESCLAVADLPQVYRALRIVLRRYGLPPGKSA